jgi:aminocarboxymuconate-semialdehyde decarboxylase
MSTDKTGPQLFKCSPPMEVTHPGESYPRLPYRTIDVHCHMLVPTVESLVEAHPDKLAQVAGFNLQLSDETRKFNSETTASVRPKLIDAQVRLDDMDASGIDIQAVSFSPTQFCYWAKEDLACTIATHINDAIAELCADHPERFIGMGTVSLQHPELAAQQLEKLILEYGFKGVQISTLVSGRDIADRFFDPFWARAEELGAVVFVHPSGTTLGSRVAEHYLMNVIGQPLETTICLSKLILGGTLDRHQNLKIIAAHGGGYLPAYSVRMDHANAARPDTGNCECRPSDYLSRIWYDSVVFDPEQLERLIAAVGKEQILTGTDYPFDMGHHNPSAMVAKLDPETQKAILGDNAATLFGLD